MTREEIIERLNIVKEFSGGKFNAEAIANWHLAEVARIVKPLIEPHSIGRETDEKYIVDIDKAIEETLKRASGETK